MRLIKLGFDLLCAYEVQNINSLIISSIVARRPLSYSQQYIAYTVSKRGQKFRSHGDNSPSPASLASKY